MAEGVAEEHLVLSGAPKQELALVTSWAANTGSADRETPEILTALRAFARALPPGSSLLVVPDEVLQSFHADVFPGAVVLVGGQVTADLPLVGNVGRELVLAGLRKAQPDAAMRPSR